MLKQLNWLAGAALAGLVAVAAVPAAPGFVGSAQAQADDQQVKLTGDMVKRFLAASRDLASLDDNAGDDEFDKVLTDNGFASADEFDQVANSIMIAATAINGQSNEEVDAIKAEIERVKKDDQLGDDERSEILDSLNAQLSPPAPKFKENVEAVKPFMKEIEQSMASGDDQ